MSEKIRSLFTDFYYILSNYSQIFFVNIVKYKFEFMYLKIAVIVLNMIKDIILSIYYTILLAKIFRRTLAINKNRLLRPTLPLPCRKNNSDRTPKFNNISLLSHNCKI